MQITHNIRQVSKALSEFARSQVPYATMLALNETANDGLVALQEEMQQSFDRPTRWTLNAFMVWRADKTSLRAEVRERPSVGRRHYLKVQGQGGTRPSTGLERLLQAKVATEANIVSATPARAAQLDAHGNWSSGERNRALSAIKAQRDAAANTTASSKTRSRAKGRAAYFVPKPGSKLSPGIYRREQGSRSMVKVLHFNNSAANYRKRIDWRDVVDAKAVEVYEGHFARALVRAMATSKHRGSFRR